MQFLLFIWQLKQSSYILNLKLCVNMKTLLLDHLTASIYKRQWDQGMTKSHNLHFIGLDGLDELTDC